MLRPASRALVDKARDLAAKGEMQEAVTHFERATSLEPTAESLLALGEARLKLKQPERAIVPLAAAATFDPQGPALTLLAEILMTLRHTALAHEIAIRALARDTNDRRAREVFVATQKDA